MVAVDVLLRMYADVIDEPGALMSTHDPQFENDDFASLIVVEPTVIAEAARAGDRVHASVFSLPAATTNVTPSAVAVPAAPPLPTDAGPPALLFTTAAPHVGCRAP